MPNILPIRVLQPARRMSFTRLLWPRKARSPCSLRYFGNGRGQFVWQVHHDIMPAGQLDDVPSWCPGIFLGKISERTGVPSIGQEVETAPHVLDLARWQNRHLEGGKRLRDTTPVHPFTVCPILRSAAAV